MGLRLQEHIASAHATARCIVLAASGPLFCAGVDLRLLRDTAYPTKKDEIRRRVYGSFQGLIRGIVTSRIPVIARIQGPCLGVGADLVLSCDIRVAATSSWLEESWIKLGAISALGGGQALRTLVGTGTALDLLLTARRIDAEEALRLGVFQRVVGDDQLDAELGTVVDRIVRAEPDAVAAMKRLVRGPEIASLDDYMARALDEQVELIGRDGFRDKVTSVLESMATRQSSSSGTQ